MNVNFKSTTYVHVESRGVYERLADVRLRVGRGWVDAVLYCDLSGPSIGRQNLYVRERSNFDEKFEPMAQQRIRHEGSKTSLPASRCMLVLRKQGLPYPRTCEVCGLGPCKEEDDKRQRKTR